MALFKVYHGDNPIEDLPQQVKDGYGYVLVNEGINAGTWTDSGGNTQTYGTGEWYIDVKPSNETTGKRFKIVSALLTDGESIYTIDDLVKADELYTDVIAAATVDPSSMRNAIGVSQTDDCITAAFSRNLTTSGWTQNNSIWQNTVSFSPPLHCGQEGAAIPVPPVITYASGSKDAFNLITDAQLNDAKTTLTFSANTKPSANITITVIDHR